MPPGCVALVPPPEPAVPILEAPSVPAPPSEASAAPAYPMILVEVSKTAEQTEQLLASTLLLEFRKYDPPQFWGEPDPSAAELWHSIVEKIFDTMRCTNQQRVPLAIFPSSSFNQKFFSEDIREQRALEFETLVQGDMSMSHYEARFVALSHFSSYLVDDERRKARRFVSSLCPALRSRMVRRLLMTFDEVVHRALVYEED
ncbi:uncharacterized protein LOC131224933 [Magnolia sinica]|uniref:uncharacterized protein LOC131224933 n=1 Tax=Magnolia sinica TaxID=86752 RepID=UPI00265A307E|nr:uncharacterized protein LOC131224933 [Magnolia sinica]